MPTLSLINNWMGSTKIDREAFEVGSKRWDWSRGSIQDPWHAGFHPRAAGRARSALFSRVLFINLILAPQINIALPKRGAKVMSVHGS